MKINVFYEKNIDFIILSQRDKLYQVMMGDLIEFKTWRILYFKIYTKSTNIKIQFVLGPKKVPCRVRIEAIDGFTYTYKLFVAEKELQVSFSYFTQIKILKKFVRESSKTLLVWKVSGLSGWWNFFRF